MALVCVAHPPDDELVLDGIDAGENLARAR